MIIYNITIKVERQIADRWLEWLQSEHIPEIMNTGCFTNSRLVRLLDIDESDGPTYALQFEAESKADYNRYLELYAAAIRDHSFEKWGEQFIAFRSLMQVVN